MPKILTLEEVNQRIANSFIQEVEVLNYTNKRSPMQLHCKRCGYIWDGKPASLLYSSNHVCPNCGVVKSVEMQCAYCGKSIQRLPSEIQSNKSGYFYCSKSCGNKHKNQLRAESGEWENSINYRLTAFTKLPHKCAICGWDEDERILEVHHIDSNRQNNQLDNLCILCPTCHRKITLGYYQLTDDFKLYKI